MAHTATFNAKAALEAGLDRIDVAAPAQPGPLSRFWAAIIAGQQARANAEVARYIAAHGGQLTDELERAISRAYGTRAGR
jgi:hypothetical protein